MSALVLFEVVVVVVVVCIEWRSGFVVVVVAEWILFVAFVGSKVERLNFHYFYCYYYCCYGYFHC